MTEPTAEERDEAERLRQLRAIIEDELRTFDVCASVVLAGKFGRFENFQHVGASWSNLRLEQFPDGSTFMGIRSRSVDYAGRPDVQRAHIEWSVGAAGGIGQLMGVAAMQWLQAVEQFEQTTGATHPPWTRDDPRDEPGLP